MHRLRQTLLLSALVLIAWAARPAQVYGRAAGGCLERGTAVLTPRGSVPVEELKPGDKVLSAVGPSLVEAEVEAITSVEPDEYCEIVVAGRLLRLTGEHPVGIAPGVFRMANALRAGDVVRIRQEGATAEGRVQSVRHLTANVPAYNLMVLPGGTYVANSIVVHNKGCFLPETLIRKEDGSEVSISRIRAGDRVLAFTSEGVVVGAVVRNIVTREVAEYRIVRTPSIEIRVTAEHPFFVGNATFKTLDALEVGDTIYAYDGKGLCPQPIESIETVAATARVYNLQTDRPNTFFANGAAVHNKGGSCFARGTMISTPGGRIPIEQIKVGDQVTAIAEDGKPVFVKVTETHATRSRLVVISTPAASLRTTAEHPIGLAGGGFWDAGELQAGSSILMWLNGSATSAEVSSQWATSAAEDVFNLTVDSPHTFIADGFVVHNKGGGGSHSSSHSNSHSSTHGASHGSSGYHGVDGAPGSSGIASWAVPLVAFGLISIVIVFCLVKRTHGEDLDYVFSEAEVAKKRDKTLKLLEFIAKQDPLMIPDALLKQAESTFLKLQESWQARDYAPMKPLLMPDLYEDHTRELAGMIRNHEIDMIEGLRINRIDLVNVRYTSKEDQREFTALITATACDYYIDDQTRKRLRGDTQPAQFQEFWTFQRLNGTWLLREIEQTRESKALKDDNFFEQFTDAGVRQVYGKDADAEGPSGTWLEKEADTKETRIERLLGFLVQTDKIWDRQAMLETSRRVFLEMTAAWESGNPSDIPGADLFPDVAAHLSEDMANNRSQGITMKFRNLCVRKVELILVRNFNDNSKDEFVARVRAHAQKIRRQNGQVTQQDQDVMPFEQFLTMGRSDNRWKLKEILSTPAGQAALNSENVDEGSNSGQLEWFYRHKRPT